jgi:hypothetical protein
MEYRCEDLPQYGVLLVPPSSPEYGALLADIERRLADPVPGSPPPQPPGFEDPAAPTVILCNRSQIAIAAVSWIWNFEPETGRPARSAVLTSGGSLLKPFGLDERARKLYGYWHVILPGSKRGIRGNRMFGDNTDVRPPQPDELWTGGGVGFGGGDRRTRGPLKSVTLALDGAFFVDGGFAGPDTLRNFDRVTADADAHVQAARIAQEDHSQGLSPAEIFTRIEAVTGPDRGRAKPRPPLSDPPGDFLTDSLRNIASQIGLMRLHDGGDARVIHMLVSWAGATLPNYRKL